MASLCDVHAFGPLLAAEAQARGFYDAQLRVFLGDGDAKNWTLHRLHFPQFIPVADFMHVVGYVYASAAALDPSNAWSLYLRHARACWQGRVHEVIAELDAWSAEHPLPADTKLKHIPNHDPRKIVHETVTYLKNNRERMDYPRYRTLGLPTTSSLVESLIKEFNLRVKGTEKILEPRERRFIVPSRGERCGGNHPSPRGAAVRRRSALASHPQPSGLPVRPPHHRPAYAGRLK